MKEEQLVLVVDDDQGCREVFRDFIQRWDFKVEVAGDLNEAARKMRELIRDRRQFTLVIDVQLPPPDPNVVGSREALIREAQRSGCVERVISITGMAVSDQRVLWAEMPGVMMLDKVGVARVPDVLRRALIEPLPA